MQASAKFQRMAVVTLHRDQVYESLDAVKMELSENIKSLAPIGLKEQVCLNFHKEIKIYSFYFIFLDTFPFSGLRCG